MKGGKGLKAVSEGKRKRKGREGSDKGILERGGAGRKGEEKKGG